MDKVRRLLHRFGDFVAGRGFAAMLMLCGAIVGVAAWIYVASNRNLPESAGEDQNSQTTLAGIGLEDGGVRPTVKPQNDGPDHQPAGVGGQETQNQEPSEPLELPNEETALPVSLGVESVQFTWPLDGAIVTTYAMDSLLYDVTMRDWRCHDGLDMACALGTKVMAVADGTVAEIRDDYLMGTTVVIDHGSGVKTYYSNLAAVPTVEPGDWVWAGYVIGSVGDTARGESNQVPHLHVAMTIDGVSVDPEDYFPN